MNELSKLITYMDFDVFLYHLKNKKEFYFCNKSKTMEIQIYCRACNNGCWEDDFMGTINILTKHSGCGIPFGVNTVMTYEKFIEEYGNFS